MNTRYNIRSKFDFGFDRILEKLGKGQHWQQPQDNNSRVKQQQQQHHKEIRRRQQKGLE